MGWLSEQVPVPRPAARSGQEGHDARVRELEAENRRLWSEHQRALERLRQDAQLGQALRSSGLDRLPRGVPARILRAHDPAPLRRSILIDRGRADGVRVGHPVVMGGVFLGRVRCAHEHTSLVQLVTDPRTRLEVFVRTSTGQLLRGFARRRGSSDGVDLLEVDFVRLRPGAGEIHAKAPVLTANFDERVPAHLLVGLVSRVSDPERDRMPTLVVRPALDLDRSTDVVVLLTGTDGIARADRRPGPR
jgi:rod shape-determining protein MreC